MRSIYKDYELDQLDELFSNFLISSWSYSKVTSFARNAKAFEMSYIFGINSRRSSTTVAGEAYHAALQYFFTKKKEGVTLDVVELEQSAFLYIDEVPANYWKIQKTTPTVEECKQKATDTVVKLLRNFIREIDIYLADVAEILDVEIRHEAFLTINGVDIPLPCHGKVDLRVRLKDGRIVVIDHKSKSVYSPEDEVALTIGIQAITYVLLCEDATGEAVDEVWFMENKYSENKSKAPQIAAFKVQVDPNTRALYESLLYEPLRQMVEAVGDPDHVYLINDADNYVDKAELYDFWARTMICEVEDFNVEAAKKDLVAKRLKKVRDASVKVISPSVIKRFKENAAQFIQYDLSSKNMTQNEKIEHSLRSFGSVVRVAHTLSGYSSDSILLEISAGIKISSIHSHRLDLANALDVANVRISKDLVVYEGRSYLCVDVSKPRETDLLYDEALLKGHKIPLGKDNFGNVVIWDLDNHGTPHVLICGSTGSGKSVCLVSILCYAQASDIENIVVLDPKRAREFRRYDGVNNILLINDILQIEEYMAKLVDYMEDLIRRDKVETTLIIFDEFADALANARKGNQLKIYENVEVGEYANGNPKIKRECTGELKSLEENLRILLQKGRSCGIRIAAGTQRASVKVITGDAKVNFPVQICFRVPRETDSRVVLDEPGAEALMGKGDGLIKSPEYPDTVRFQAFYKP